MLIRTIDYFNLTLQNYSLIIIKSYLNLTRLNATLHILNCWSNRTFLLPFRKTKISNVCRPRIYSSLILKTQIKYVFKFKIDKNISIYIYGQKP